MFGNKINLSGFKLIIYMDSSAMSVSLSGLGDENSPVNFFRKREATKPRREQYRELQSDYINSLPGIFKDLSIGSKRVGVSESRHMTLSLVNVFLGEPFAFSAVREKTQTSKDAIKLSADYVESIVSDMEKNFIEDLEQTQGRKNHSPSKHFKLIEQKLAGTYLNGYPVKDILTKSANEFKIKLSISVARNELIEKVTDRINGFFGQTKIKFSEIDSGIADFLVKIKPDKPDFFVVRIGNDNSEASIVREGYPTGKISFEMSGSSVLKELAKNLSVSRTVADSYARLSLDKKLHDRELQKLTDVYSKYVARWQNDLLSAIESLDSGVATPNTVYFIAESEIEKILVQNIISSKDKGNTVFARFYMEDVDIKLALEQKGVTNQFIKHAPMAKLLEEMSKPNIID